MNSDVDLRELAIDRGTRGQSRSQTRRHLLTRYVLPLGLLLGFLLLIAWATRDVLFPPTPVTVVPVFATQSLALQDGTPLFNAAGWIEPRPTPVRVAALAPGVVEKLLVVEDQPVKSGEPIAELVKDDAKLAYEAALATLKLREAELSESRAAFKAAKVRLEQPVHLEAMLAEAAAALAKTATQLKNLPFESRRAAADYEATRRVYESKLSAQGVVAGVEIEVAKSQAEAANALVEELRDRAESLAEEAAALKQRRDALKTQLELLTEETQARDEADARAKGAEARVEQARVAVAERELQLRRMTVRSPIDGRVFRLIAHPGARLGGGMTHQQGHDASTVVTLYRPDMLQVRVDVRFEDIPSVHIGQPVHINNPALDSSLMGRVLFKSSEADIQKNTLQVKVEVPDPPPVFKPEMLVDVTFLSHQSTDLSHEPTKAEAATRIYVLRELVHADGDNTYVWLADQSAGVARQQSVRIADGGDEFVEVLDGLTVSSRLIASSTERLIDGGRIRVTGEDATIGDSLPFNE